MERLKFASVLLLAVLLLGVGSTLWAKEISRPEEIRSMREVVYDQGTYQKLEKLWKQYYDAYPSEYAYANWMYAARYAHDPDYWDLLNTGLKKYDANPTLLYLKSLENLGTPNNTEAIKYMERATALDPNYTDPWFVLVTQYMDARDNEKLDLALRKILESGAITDEVMDFNYNILISLEPNAILITNGDNDTYPGWILTRLLKVRPDVAIVNRSLLNTEWYPLYKIEQGLPRFIGKDELLQMRDTIFAQMKANKQAAGVGGPLGDTLMQRIVESAQRAGRPVYLAKTLYSSPVVNGLSDNGYDLGLVTLVTKSDKSYAETLRAYYKTWIDDYRTGGLDGWRLRESPQTDAGRMLVTNYAPALVADLPALKENAPDLRRPLFEWYLKHMEPLLGEDLGYKMAQGWCCYAKDMATVTDWCKKQGVECKESKQD